MLWIAYCVVGWRREGMGGGRVFLAVIVLLFFSPNAYVFVDMILWIIGYHYS